MATGDIYALDSYAIYEGLLSPENIIGTNLQVIKSNIVFLSGYFDNFQFSEPHQLCGFSGWMGLACPPLATTGEGTIWINLTYRMKFIKRCC